MVTTKTTDEEVPTDLRLKRAHLEQGIDGGAASSRVVRADDAIVEERIAERTKGISRALQDHRELLERERAQRERLQEANCAKDRLLSILAHDLRGPLNAVLGWTALLRRELLDGGTRDVALATIERNARIQAELLDEMLDIARIGSSKLQLDLRAVDLAEAVRAVLEGFTSAAETRGVTLVPALGNGFFVLADLTRLRHLVGNVVRNALSATPPGGRIEVSLEQDATYARLRVVDTGRGIEPEALATIFECAPRVDASSTGLSAGRGLGLYIARHLVEMHGGSIAAASEGQGRGAELTITLPLLDRSAPPPSMTLRLELADVKVVVVEADEDTRELLAITLERHGATLRTSADVETANEIFDAFAPDVVLCGATSSTAKISDIEVFLGRIAKSRSGGARPALVIIGDAASTAIVDSLDVDARVSLPLAADRIAHAIRSALDGRNLASRSSPSRAVDAPRA